MVKFGAKTTGQIWYLLGKPANIYHNLPAHSAKIRNVYCLYFWSRERERERERERTGPTQISLFPHDTVAFVRQ